MAAACGDYRLHDFCRELMMHRTTAETFATRSEPALSADACAAPDHLHRDSITEFGQHSKLQQQQRSLVNRVIRGPTPRELLRSR